MQPELLLLKWAADQHMTIFYQTFLKVILGSIFENRYNLNKVESQQNNFTNDHHTKVRNEGRYYIIP